MNKFAIIDVETGGFSVTKNGICEIALLIVSEDLEIVQEFSSLIKPYTRPDSDELVSYKDDAMSVNGINIKLLEDAPEVEDVVVDLEALLELHEIKKVVGHNVTFDKDRIEYLTERFGCGFKFIESDCTMKKARSACLDVKDHKLETLCLHFGITNNSAHRALSDALATLELLKVFERRDANV